jgi:hypothetical protein
VDSVIDISQSTECADLFAALAAFQGEVQAPRKTASNPHFKSKFADLAEVLETVRAPMAKHGLSITQIPVGACDTHVRLVTLVAHKSGQWIKGVLDMPLGQKTPQGVGSAISYARRYVAMSMLGVAADDDDGEQAQGRGGPGVVKAAPNSPREAANQSRPDPAPAIDTLNRELAAQSSAEALAAFHNHAIGVLAQAQVPEGPAQEFWNNWGKRCVALKLNPREVAAAARAKGRAA